MTMQTKTIGRMPTDHGPYVNGQSYGKKFQVELYGCVWESKHDNNNTAPATLNTQAGTITPNTTDWKKVTGSTDQWLIDNGYKPVSANNVKDGNQSQHDINSAFATEIDSIETEIGNDSTPASVKGRIKTLETEVGNGGSVDERIAEEGARHYLKSETYTKQEVNGLVSTPHQEYVTVADFASLPVSGSEDTIYRVSNYDGTQVAAGVYSEYAWNGTQYVFLCAKSSVAEVFDISEYHSGQAYATLEDALDPNSGGGVPQSLQNGGMSIKFVRTSDNKYVQYRLMSDTFNTTEANWQGVDDEPTAGSDNLIKSGGIIFYPTLYHTYNNIISEVAIVGSDETPDMVLYKDGTNLYVQFYIGSTLVRQANFYGGCESGEIREAVVRDGSFTGTIYVLLSDRNLISTLSSGSNQRVKISKQCHNLSYSKKISDYLDNMRYSDNFFYDKSVIREIYTTSQESNIYIKMYVSGSYKALQFYNGSNNLIDQIDNTLLNSYQYAKGQRSGLFEVVFGDVSTLLSLDHSTKQYQLTSLCKDLIQCPILYARNKTSNVSNSIIATHIKELYLDVNDQKLYGRFYVDSSIKALQIFNSTTLSSANLVTQFVLENTGFIQDTKNCGCVYIDNIDISQTSSVFALYDDVKDIFNSPLIFAYLGKTITVSPTGYYSNLVNAILKAEEYNGATVYVKDGTYDIIAEMREIYGSNYFDDYTYTNIHSRGLELKNNIKVVFSSQAKVVCNYEGSNVQVMEHFSPFNIGEKGFTLENLDITAKNVRYCVHDDAGFLNTPYQNNYLNCKMYLDNRNNTAWNNNQCIGGGFGKSGIINIVACEFETENTGSQTDYAVSYHNAGISDAQSHVNVRDCYFSGNSTFRISYYGESIKISTAYVCGCSFGDVPRVTAEAGSTNINVEMISWNNELR